MATLHAQGLIDKEIAAAMDVDFYTVRTYWKRVKTKLGTHTQTATVLEAIRRGDISVDGVFGRAA